MLHPIYLKFFLMRENVRRYLMENVSGVGGSLTRVNSTVVGKIEIPLAPRPEQERIASAVDAAFTELDEAAAALARAREGMAQFRASLLHAACTGQLTAAWRAANPPAETGAALLARILAARRAAWERTECARLQVRGTPPRGDAWKARYVEPVAPDLTDLPDLPEGWAWASLDQLLSMMTSGSRAWAPYYDRGSGVFIMAQNVRPGRLDLRHRQMVDPPENDPERKRTLVSSNDILITIVGANTGDVCHVDRDLEDHFVCQSVALLRPVDASVAPYLTAYLVSPSDGRAILDQMAYGAGRPHLSFDQLKSMPIPMPSAAEQEIMRSVIAELTGELDTTTQIDQASALSVSLRQSILHAAFTGRLVPQDSEDEPAAALLARLRATAAPRRARLTHRV
jgi:type I restriction enzyme S subunit